MKIDKSQILVALCLTGLVTLLVVAIWFDKDTPQPPSPARIKYLRDSLEMEYYRKAIENSYPFDHSRIPTHESNP